MADYRIQYTEHMVGAGHPSFPDTLNRLTLIEHNTDGTHTFIHRGAGSPEGAVTGIVGDLYLRTDGGASTTLYVKESGTGNTGWVGK
jgi:hypothetical protein